jgi:signal transduction histidine kinase
MPAPAASTPNGRFAPIAVPALTVVVFATVVAIVTLQLRAGLQQQILRDEAEKLGAVVTMLFENGAKDLGPNLTIENEPETWWPVFLRASTFQGVVGGRIFDRTGEKRGGWPPGSADHPPAERWRRVSAGESVAILHRDQISEEVVGLPTPDQPEPALEIWVPLRRSGAKSSFGAAEFWVRGGNVAADLAEHDRRLWLQAGFAWLTGSIVIVLGLTWAFRRLASVNRELLARGEDLQRANRELVLAAKTSALGAVTAHLMHELKNPIAGLEVLVAGQGEATAPAWSQAGGELAAASELTRRLRTMVNDVVAVMRDEQSGVEFELTPSEIVEAVKSKVQADAREHGVTLEFAAPDDPPLGARRANLATLVLRNLLQNAIEATPAGGVVRLTGRAQAGGEVEFVAGDGGPGLPATVRARLFQPCASTKIGGSGLGLALSYQLAQHAGGKLELVRSDERGTSFRLVLSAEA